MKIALVILHADPDRGGAERYTCELAQALARFHDVSLLATSFPQRPRSGVHCVQIAASGYTRTGRYRHFLDSLDQHLGEIKYDIIHAMLPVRRCDLYHPHAGLAIQSVEQAKGLKRLNNAMNPRRGKFAEVERTLLSGPGSPMLLCLSQHMRQNAIADGICPPERAVVLFNAVDLRRFDPSKFPPIPSAHLQALLIAQDFERKGVAAAIEAIARTLSWRLTVVGKGDAAPYERLAFSLGAQERVSFVGPLDDVRPMYQKADVFLLPTRHDPCSLVVLEALAMGVPVISTLANGACEIMTDGVHGFVMDDSKNIDAIVSSLRELMEQSRRTVMRAACLQLREKLSFDVHVERLIAIAQHTRHNDHAICETDS